MRDQATGKSRDSVLTLALTGGVPKRSFLAALIVGTLLNLINQADVLWTEGHVNVIKLLLTYLVPYCVATYGAVSARRYLMRMGSG